MVLQQYQGGGRIVSLSDTEKSLFESASRGVSAAQEALVVRYQKILFAFILSFAPYSREQAYQLTIDSFTGTFQERRSGVTENPFLQVLFRHVVELCERAAPSGVTDLSPFGDFPQQKQQALRIVREALIHLEPKDKILILLRDQAHLPFERIGGVLGLDVRQAQQACLLAREHMRDAVKSILERPPARESS